MTDAFPRFVRLVVTENVSSPRPSAEISSPSALRGSVAVFRPGAGVPSRRDVVLARVRSGFEVALVESETEPNDDLNEKATGSVFARFKVEGVEANVASAFASLGLDPDPTARIAARVTLRFAVDRGGVATLEKATSAVEVREGSAEVVEGALRVTETETEIRGGTRLAELEAERRALRWLRSRDEARAAADAAASALEGDALRTRDRLERSLERATRASRGDEARERADEGEDVAALRLALEKALDAADDALAATFLAETDSSDSSHPESSSAFDAKRRVSATRRLRRELVDAADAFFERVREDEEDEEERNPIKNNGHSSSDGESEADAARLVLELEDRVAELERDLDACRRGAKGDDGGTARVEL